MFAHVDYNWILLHISHICQGIRHYKYCIPPAYAIFYASTL